MALYIHINGSLSTYYIDEFRDIIRLSLSRPDAFGKDISQHISNTLWGLAKLDASWSDMPSAQLETAFW